MRVFVYLFMNYKCKYGRWYICFTVLGFTCRCVYKTPYAMRFGNVYVNLYVFMYVNTKVYVYECVNVLYKHPFLHTFINKCACYGRRQFMILLNNATWCSHDLNYFVYFVYLECICIVSNLYYLFFFCF